MTAPPPNNDPESEAVTVCRADGVVLVTVPSVLPDAVARSRLSSVLDDLLQQRGNVFLAVELPDLDATSAAAVDLVIAVTDGAWGRASRRSGQGPAGGFAGVPPTEPRRS